MTIDINKYYGVNISHGEKEGPRLWRSKASIFRRDNQKEIKTIYGEGGTRNSANSKAISNAKKIIFSLGIPNNWSDKS